MRKSMFPLVSVMSGVATGVVLLVAAALVGGLFFMIRMMTDDSDKYKQIKDFAQALLGPPAPSRPGGEESKDEIAAGGARIRPAGGGEAFSEPCPGCGTTVTEEHVDCPSCGLRLL